MTRTCTDATKRKIARMGYFRTRPAWLRAAVNDALSDKPMSLRRERKMRIALGFEPPQRPRYWRPCLPMTLTPEQRKEVVRFAQALVQASQDGA